MAIILWRDQRQSTAEKIMKLLVLLSAAVLSACAGDTSAVAFPPRMVVAYRDLRLDAADDRARLVRRVDLAAGSFCKAYDPMDPDTRFDAQLASERNCPGAAAILLAQHMPANVRRAYRAGRREQGPSRIPAMRKPKRPASNWRRLGAEAGATAPAFRCRVLIAPNLQRETYSPVHIVERRRRSM
ncbi:UrcA family protein [Sphingomonas sp.]|uniref:UrcA family protein n=1 Tax=Sphingomonas sp. TaxID=28214 RepID=UPI0028ADBBF4|nr:UrcA family protein [Sphingomonas sp.]